MAISGTPLTPIATSVVRFVFGPTPRPDATAPNSSDSGRSLVGHHECPGRQLARPALELLAGAADADPKPAADAVGVKRPDGDAGLDHGDGKRVVEACSG